MQQINTVAGFEALLCCQQTFQLNTQKLNECKEVTKLGPESSGSSVTQSLVSKVGSTNRTQQLQREWGRFILLVQNKHGIFYCLHLQGQRNKREHIFILSFCVPIWYKYSIWEKQMQMSPVPSTAICRGHFAVLSVRQSHKALPPCARFSHLAAFELTLQDSVHLLLASCCVSVLWVSHLPCAAGSAAALHCLLLPSPFSVPLHRELLSQDEVVSLPKVFLETCFFQTPTRYLRRWAFTSSFSLST